jgi:hypothetical protein
LAKVNTMTATPFLAHLETAIADLRATVHTHFTALGPVLLNQRPAPTSWSILECLEHLNRYSRYCNPAFAKALTTTAPLPSPPAEVTYSWLGSKSVAMMRPTNGKKSRALKHLNPLGSCLDREVLTEFDRHQARLLELPALARTANLNRKAVPVEFFRLLKLRLGEALEFVVVHQQRHVQQAQRVQAGLRAELAC